jgi:hypothetical protein
MTDPIQGWVSTGYGNVSPAPVFCATVLDRTPSSSITILVSLNPETDEKDIPELNEEIVAGGRGTACSLEIGGVKDVFVLPLCDTPVRFSDFEGQGEFFWIRYRSGEIHELFCINANHASIGDCDVLAQSTQGACAHIRFDHGRTTTTPLEEPYVHH